MEYPVDARENGIMGKVYVQFVIDTTGKILPESVHILKGLNNSCNEEAKRVIEESPKWIPGIQAGKKVRVQMILPVVFELN